MWRAQGVAENRSIEDLTVHKTERSSKHKWKKLSVDFRLPRGTLSRPFNGTIVSSETTDNHET